MGAIKKAHRVLVGKPERRRQLRRPSAYGRIILKWLLKKLGGRVWTGFVWFRAENLGELYWTW
jgi:hypothetical protein